MEKSHDMRGFILLVHITIEKLNEYIKCTINTYLISEQDIYINK